MNEKLIERKLVTAVKARGGIAPKFVSPGYAGMPDRLVLLPARHEMLRRLGFRVYVIDGIEQIGGMLNELQTP